MSNTHARTFINTGNSFQSFMIMQAKLRTFLRSGNVLRYATILFFVLNLGMAAENYAQEHLPMVDIPGTELRRIASTIVGQEYDLHIHLPRDYANADRAYPVLYLLDAQWDFPLVTAIYGQQFYDGFVPGLVIVGITWGGKNPNHDSLRARDLTPTHVASLPQSGGAPKFFAFIKDELVPFIASKYRITDDRTLMGSSFGGLFTLYALFNETELFQRYVLTSPALGWDNEVVYTYAKNFVKRKSQALSRVFMAVGDCEDVTGFQKFSEHLKSREFEGLTLQAKVLESTGHSGSKAEGFTRGLQAVFARPTLQLATETLEKYVGDYQIDHQLKISISDENGHLVIHGPRNAQLVLHAESEKDFYVRGQFWFMHFKEDAANKIIGFQLEQFSRAVFARKLTPAN